MFTVEALCEYIFNFGDLSNRPSWKRCAYNALAKIILSHLRKIEMSLAVAGVDNEGVPPYSKTEFMRAFCHEFCYWRCGRDEDDTTTVPIVWHTIPTNMLHPENFGKALRVLIPNEGSTPSVQDSASPDDRSRILGLLNPDSFFQVMCTVANKSIFKMVTMKMLLIEVLLGRPFNNEEFEVKKTEICLRIADSYLCQGIRFASFFASEEKASDYIANTIAKAGLTGLKLSKNKTWSIKANKQIWKVICGSEENAIRIFQWLFRPNDQERPSLTLLAEDDTSLVQQMRNAVTRHLHFNVLKLAKEGVFTTEFFRYLYELRSQWEANRFVVGLRIDADYDSTPEEMYANYNMAKALGISAHLESSIIRARQN